MRMLAALLLIGSPLSAAEVPSGQEVELHEVLVDAQDTATYLRFRFLAPQIAAGPTKIDFGVAGTDMMHLCNSLALPYVAEYALKGDRIVISFMDRITEFGVPDPDATQYFEQFRAESGVCMWDEF